MGGLAARVHVPAASQDEALYQKRMTFRCPARRRLNDTSGDAGKSQPVDFSNS
jgi:hypothetical protein